MKALFIAYQEVSNPLMMYSQGFPYIMGLSDKGVDFCVLSFESRESRIASENFINSQARRLNWQFIYFSCAPSLICTFIDIIKGIIKASAIIKKDKIDIIHARSPMAAIIAFVPARIFKKKLFFDTRGLLSDKYAGGALIKRNSVIYKVLKRIEYALLRYSDFATVETFKHLSVLKRWSPALAEKVAVIPCCVDTGFFKDNHIHSITANSFTIVYLGKTGTWHKVNEIFDFFKVVTEEFKNASLLFLTQEPPDNIKGIARAKGIDEHRLRVIAPERSKLPELLSSSDSGIMFINAYHGYNSTHIKFGEYLACGLPVILNNGIGDTRQIIEKEKVGVIANDFNRPEYRRVLGELTELLKFREELRLRCRRAAEKYFSLDAGIDKYWQIYRRLAA